MTSLTDRIDRFATGAVMALMLAGLPLGTVMLFVNAGGVA